ncbi:MAG: aldehyde dehydrogenase family protein, partial [Minisyncoccia bacterium]
MTDFPVRENFINGEFTTTKERQPPKICPTHETEMGCWPNSPYLVVYTACGAARDSFPAWAGLSRLQRGEYFNNLCRLLESRIDDAVYAICMDTGKSLNESRAEVIESLHMAQYTFGRARDEAGKYLPSEFPSKEIVVLRKPKGVVAVISPWNFPMAIGGFWSAAPALLEGNTVVWKPSELAPHSADFVAKLYRDAGFPRGVFNVVHGDKQTGRMLSQDDVNHIVFTGSVEAGQAIRVVCAGGFGNKTCQCETGSKSAVMVFADADRQMALQACVASAFKLSGQRCVSAGRLLVERRIFDDFIEQFVEKARTLKIGAWNDPTPSDMGPIISQSQMERVQQYNDHIGREYSLKLHLQGTRLDLPGYFLTPHIYEAEWRLPEDRPCLVDEVFGPHVVVIPFADVDHAAKIYNDTKYGLSLG